MLFILSPKIAICGGTLFSVVDSIVVGFFVCILFRAVVCLLSLMPVRLFVVVVGPA